MDTIKGWKTVIFNVAMLALASPDILNLMSPRVAVYASVVGNLILRAITTTPIGRSEASMAKEAQANEFKGQQ